MIPEQADWPIFIYLWFAKNFSRGPKRGGSGGIGVNTMIDSVQQEDP
jgi:hypothetical protein